MKLSMDTNTKAALSAVKAIADAIRELGGVPSGHLYAPMSAIVPLEQYQAMLDILKRAGLVHEDNSHFLRWTGTYPLAPSGMNNTAPINENEPSR